MKINKILFLIFASGCLLLAGCAGRPINLGETNQQVDLAKVDFTKGRDLSASATGFQLLLLIPININDRHERAFQQLRGQAGNDYITDIKIQESWAWGLVGTAYKTTIEAKAYPYK
jgi:hypothetical protein